MQEYLKTIIVTAGRKLRSGGENPTSSQWKTADAGRSIGRDGTRPLCLSRLRVWRYRAHEAYEGLAYGMAAPNDKGGTEGLLFHDLRHQAITELREAGLSDMTIMGIAGQVSREMLAHYSHIRLQAKRQAVEALEMPLSTLAKPVAQGEATRVN